VTARPAICLNMIVGNEAHIVREVFDAVAPYITSWVIVDTGTARLDRMGGIDDTDPDPIAGLGRRAAVAGLGTASLDEVLCIAGV
jgi:hypothetical protein